MFVITCIYYVVRVEGGQGGGGARGNTYFFVGCWKRSCQCGAVPLPGSCALMQIAPFPPTPLLFSRKSTVSLCCYSGLLLWEKAAENINLVAVIISTPNFAPCLEASLRGRSLAGAGLVQLMTCDHAR